MLETIITTASLFVMMTRPVGSAHLSLVVLIVLCGDRGWSMLLQKFRVRPESVEVTEGEDVKLLCVVENQQGKAQWTKDGFALGFERDVPGYPRYSYTGDPTLGQHHLVISGVTLTEDGEYQCQVGPTDTTPPIWSAANVTVLLAPTSISLVGWSEGAVVEMRPGTSLTLECVVTNARPPPRLWWYKDGIQIKSDQATYQIEDSALPRRWSVQSQLVITAEEEDDGRSISCEAGHPALKDSPAPLQASVKLAVMHPPSPPVITGYQPEEILRAGDRRTLSCRSRGGNPQPTVSWYRLGHLVDDTSASDAAGTVNTLELAVTSEEDGAVYECRVGSEYLEAPLASNVTLTVYYSPSSVSLTGPTELEEGKQVTLVCETSESNPPSSLRWSVQGKDLNKVKERVSRVSTGGWVTSSELTYHMVRSHSRETEVAIECRAVNPAIDQIVKKKLVIGITQPPGPPVLEGDLGTEVIAGSTLDLQCSSMGGYPPPTVRIYKEDKEIYTSTLRKDNVTIARGRIEVSPVDNGAKVTCVVTGSAARAPLLTSATLTVLFAPWEVAGSVIPDIVEAGESVTLSCESSSSHPPANITWKYGDAVLKSQRVHLTQGAFGGTNTRSEMQMRPRAEDNGRAITCEADNGLGSVVKTEVTLNVLHGPRWVDEPAPQLDVYEGAELVIIATASSNPGPPKYWWWRGAELLPASDEKLRLGRVNRKLTGNYTVTAYSQKGAINSTFFLNVQYGPEQVEVAEVVRVGEGESISTKCSAEGNPTPSLKWLRGERESKGMNSTVTERPLSEGVGVAILRVVGAKHSDTGVYLCLASNVVASAPPARTKILVSQAVTVVRDAVGSRGSWASLGTNGRLMCRVQAAPTPVFVWSFQDGVEIESSAKYKVHKPELVDGLVMWVSVLEVGDVASSDYVAYRCTAKNRLGTDSILLALHPPARPHTPTDFRLTNVSDSTISLSWKPNYAGGAPLGYMLRYHPTDIEDYQYVRVAGGAASSVTLKELVPGLEYTVTIQARNEHGSSAYATPPLAIVPRAGPVRDADAVKGSGSATNAGFASPLLLVLLALAAVGLLAVNFAVVTCFLRWRRKNAASLASSSSKKISLDSVGMTPGSSPEASHRQVLLSLTTLSSTSPPGYRVECQPNSGASDLGATHLLLPPPLAPTSDRRSSSCSSAFVGADRIPTPQDCRVRGGGGASPLLPNGRLPSGVALGTGSDSVSLCSYHSDHTYVYSQEYLRQVSHALHLHHQERARRKAAHRSRTQQEQGRQRATQQKAAKEEEAGYPGISPAGPYSISLSQDTTPISYATLGSRRPTTKLTTFQRGGGSGSGTGGGAGNETGGGIGAAEESILKINLERSEELKRRRQSLPSQVIIGHREQAEERGGGARSSLGEPPGGGGGGGGRFEGRGGEGGPPTAQTTPEVPTPSAPPPPPLAPEEVLLEAINSKARRASMLAPDLVAGTPRGEIQVLGEAGGITVTVEGVPGERKS